MGSNILLTEEEQRPFQDLQDLNNSTSGPGGLYECYSGDPQSGTVVDIVFVHGLTGNRYNTWRHKESGTFWPADLLPKIVPDARIFTYGYDADIVNFWTPSSQNRIGDHARSLANELAQHRDNTDTETRPVLFVAHSLGGLVCKNAFTMAMYNPEDHIEALARATKGFAFLGVPHHGADHAHWATTFGNFVKLVKQTNSELLEVMKPSSEVLAMISQEFHGAIRSRNQNRQTHIDMTCFWEELPVSGVGDVVPKHSSILPDYPALGIHSNHMDMTKFKSADERGFRVVSGELMRWTKKIRKEQQSQQVGQESTAVHDVQDDRARILRDVRADITMLQTRKLLLEPGDAKRRWSHMTLEAWNVYERIYDRLRAQTDHINLRFFKRSLGPSAPGEPWLSKVWQLFQADVEHRTPKSVVFAVLYMIHLEFWYPGDKLHSGSKLNEGEIERFRAMAEWVPCYCDVADCKLEWNFAGSNLGMYRGEPAKNCDALEFFTFDKQSKAMEYEQRKERAIRRFRSSNRAAELERLRVACYEDWQRKGLANSTGSN